MLSLRGLRVEVGNFALRDIDLSIETGDYFMVVGPTGAGKTLLLETIAGLYPVHSGEIWLNGENITRLEPERRGVGIVYQDSALFPHLSVADNIVFGLKVRRSAGDIERQLNDMAALVKVGHLLGRKPQSLSGGEKQKVALARSLIVKPQLLLLDEPFSALDPETRESLRWELRRIHAEFGTSMIQVTHDFEEALLLGKHAALVGEGQLKQVGTPEDIFRHPNSEFVAGFTMMKNVFREGWLTEMSGEAPSSPAEPDWLRLLLETRRDMLAYGRRTSLSPPNRCCRLARTGSVVLLPGWKIRGW